MSRLGRFDPLGPPAPQLRVPQTQEEFLTFIRTSPPYDDPRLIMASRARVFTELVLDNQSVYMFLNRMVNDAVRGNTKAYTLWVELIQSGTVMTRAGPMLTVDHLFAHQAILFAWFGKNPHNFFAYHVRFLKTYKMALRYHQNHLASTYGPVVKVFNPVLQQLNASKYYPLTTKNDSNGVDPYTSVLMDLVWCMSYDLDAKPDFKMAMTKPQFVHDQVVVGITREYMKYLLRGGIPLDDIFGQLQHEMRSKQKSEWVKVFHDAIYLPLKPDRWRPKF